MLRPSTAVDRDRTCANVEDGLKNRALKASYCSRPRVHARFLRTRRYASAGISHYRLSVCLSVTRRYCSKMAKRKITQTTPRDMVTAQVLQFFDANSRCWATPIFLKFAFKVTPLRTQRFRSISAQSASTVRAGEKNDLLESALSTSF